MGTYPTPLSIYEIIKTKVDDYMQFGDLLAKATNKYEVLEVKTNVEITILTELETHAGVTKTQGCYYDVYYDGSFVAGNLNKNELIKLLNKQLHD